MYLTIIQSLRNKPGFEAARLIGCASQYITDANLINILNQFDLNNKKNDANIIKQINMFASIPGIKEQVAAWLSS